MLFAASFAPFVTRKGLRRCSGYLRRRSGHLRRCSGYLRCCSGRLRRCSGHLRRCSGHLRRCSGHLRRCSGYLRRCSGHLRRCSGYLRRCSGYLRRCSGYLRRCSGYLRPRSGYLRRCSRVRVALCQGPVAVWRRPPCVDGWRPAALDRDSGGGRGDHRSSFDQGTQIWRCAPIPSPLFHQFGDLPSRHVQFVISNFRYVD
jgi:hypothetical protein